MTDVFFKHTVTGTMPAALNTFPHQHPQLSLSPFYTRGSRHPQSGKLRKFVGTVNILRNSDSRINVIPEPIFLTIMLFCLTKKKKKTQKLRRSVTYIISGWPSVTWEFGAVDRPAA